MKKFLFGIVSLLLVSSLASAETWEYSGSFGNTRLDLPMVFVDTDSIKITEKNDKNEISSFNFQIAIRFEESITYVICEVQEAPFDEANFRILSAYSIDDKTKKTTIVKNEPNQLKPLDNTYVEFQKAYFRCWTKLRKDGHSFGPKLSTL